jgi:hypothetical protein
MQFSTAKILVPAVLGLAGTFMIAGDAEAVAGFSRQTGMTCNSCHTLHGAPTPNFTFTGKKFNAVGYRLPGAPHSVQERSQEQGEDDDRGEYFKLLPTTFSGRMQYQAGQVSEPSGGDWGDVITNPSSRLAFFPFVGPIGRHFGVWTEFYIVPFTSQDNEWGIADTSYEEVDFRYIFNPDNMDYTIGMALSNQSVYELFGFGPYPGLPSYLSRGGVGGYSHPNKAQVYTYGWMHDRWVWALGADTGDTNYNWSRSNVIGFFGYALRNRNDDELWINIAARSGGDALPLVSASGAQASSRSWQYRDAVGGVSNTRRVNPADPTSDCIAAVLQGRRPPGSCSYIAEELDDQHSIDLEVRWGAQNVDRFFGSNRQPGVWSFEHVFRVGTNSEDYFDGAGTDRDTWGVQTVIGWKHTYFVKPSLQGHFKYEFTDMMGTRYDIDTKPAWNLTFAYKPVENFLLYLSYANNQSNSLTADATSGRSLQVTADLSF